MGDIKPLGSEKLEGLDKIQRILEIARYNEKVPYSVNETAKSEYNLSLADGNNYEIVKEKNGYIIKKSLNESTTEYIDPIENRKYHKSYSSALRKLNLMAKEMNELHGNSEGVSLFSEQKKFVLKTPKSDLPEPSPEPAPAPAPDVTDMSSDMMEPTDAETSMTPDSSSMPTDGPEETGDVGGDESMGDTGSDLGDNQGSEEISFKSIQKLVGKLGQKLRAIGDSEEMTSKDIKYVLNSVISAVDLDKLEDDDKEEIMGKFESDEGDYGVEPEVDVEKDVDVELEEPSSEMKEDETGSLGKKFNKAVGSSMVKGLMNSMKGGEMEEDKKHGLDDIFDGIFENKSTESKVDKVLSKYFILSESEKKEKKQKDSMTLSEIQRLSETKQQRLFSEKLYNKVPTIKLIGKTNKKNLVFEHKNKQIKVSPQGRII